MSERPYLSIGEVLAVLREEFPDITISKIRFLESEGLLDPERTPSGYRKFYDADVERLRWILRQQREHYLPLRVIKTKLVEVESADADPDEEHPARTVGATASVQAPERPRPAPVFTPPPPPPPPAPPPGAVMSLTLEELGEQTGLTRKELVDLERFGLVVGRTVGGTSYYDEEALHVAGLAAGFLRFGVEARHLRMYKSAAEREAGTFEQIVLPLMKQRNPQSRQQALDTLAELSRLGEGLRAAMLRVALRDFTGA